MSILQSLYSDIGCVWTGRLYDQQEPQHLQQQCLAYRTPYMVSTLYGLCTVQQDQAVGLRGQGV